MIVTVKLLYSLNGSSVYVWKLLCKPVKPQARMSGRTGKLSTTFLFLSCPPCNFMLIVQDARTKWTNIDDSVHYFSQLICIRGFSHTKYFHCVKLTPDDSKIRLLNGIYCLEDMTSSLLNNNTASQFSAWERTPSYAPTPGDFGRERTPSKYCLSLNHTYGGGSTPLGHPESCRLGFLNKPEYHDGTYNEGSPSSIIYLIEWKVTLNNQILAKNTEQDLVLKPSSYWQQIKEKADHIGQQKITCK